MSDVNERYLDILRNTAKRIGRSKKRAEKTNKDELKFMVDKLLESGVDEKKIPKAIRDRVRD
ncbi:hypothetical protein Q9251_02955 [Alkalihalobacillus macyae]|uniref:hypothetical protein n=1 Tax=Guptibacillus hwajinpoensis TaxID=208199 RepID=UPI00273C089A|nr:hypothetical protein [Alkalihalobacillus macyae]MDP4549834.1 hypothetical protein [Alkalihalobacillus macyae]